MSDTDTRPRETRAERKARLDAEREAARLAGPDLAYLATLTSPEDLSDEDRATFESLTEDQVKQLAKLRDEAAQAKLAEEVGDFAVAESNELRQASTPVRNRKPVQQAMDAVAAKAYQDWIAAGRPTTWQRMPVITYYIDPGTEDGHGSLADFRKWIRAAVQIVPAVSYEKDGKTIEPSGVRVRFGKEFVLSEDMATKIHKPDKAGMTVLAWAAIDKRHVADRNGNDED